MTSVGRLNTSLPLWCSDEKKEGGGVVTEGLRHTMPSCVCQAVGTSVGTRLADGRLQGLGRVISIYCAASPRKNLRHVNSQGLCKH